MENMAYEDFNRAYRRGFWRKLSAWLSGKSNELLPYEEVRQQLPFQGQHDIGLQTVPLEKIVGSVGRYRDFDRAFLPTQKFTAGRWINISKARYRDVELPPIEAYKIGDVYFVRDGNHRVSVAREREQAFIDAYVIEINVPIAVTPDMALDDLLQKKKYAEFMRLTNLYKLRPNIDLELSLVGEYDRILGHIDTHRYYLSIERGFEVTYEETAVSWYDNVYVPLVEVIKEHKLSQSFPNYTLTDLYLFVSEYQWLLREEDQGQDNVERVTAELMTVYNQREVRRILTQLRRANWISQMILDRERADFLAKTHLTDIQPGLDISLSLPGKYDNMLSHINAHQYYMGEEQHADVPFIEAAASFFDNVYKPLLTIIQEQEFIDKFPNRTEADLCLWVLDHRQDIVEALDSLPNAN